MFEDDEEDYLSMPVVDINTEQPIVPSSSPEEEEDLYSLPVQKFEAPVATAPVSPVAPVTKPLTTIKAPAPVEGEEPVILNQSDVLADPSKVGAVRDYMIDRFGVQWKDRPDEEVVDSYTTHMHYVNANEIYTIGEYRYITNSDEEKKARAGEAYKVYQQLGNMFTNESVGEIAEGVYDYAAGLITSPSTWLGGFVGRAVTGAATTAAKRAIIQTAARQAFKTGGKPAAAKVIAEASKRKALAEIGIATLSDSAMATYGDTIYQSTMMEAGAQDQYSLLQTAVSAIGGLAGGGFAAVPIIAKSTNKGLAQTGKSIRASSAQRNATAIDRALPRIRKSVSKVVDDSVSWAKMLKEGKPAMDMPLKELTEMNSWFYDSRNPDSIFNILIEEGMRFKGTDSRVTEQFVNFVRNMPAQKRDEVNEALGPLGIQVGELANIVARLQSESGKTMNLASQAAKIMQEVNGVTAARTAANKAIVEGSQGVSDDVATPEVARYVASLWRRLLVSHPATTIVNVQGWGQAFGARSIAEVLHGGALGTSGLVGKALGRKWGDKQLNTARHLIKNQIFKAKTLLDPYSTRESFQQILEELGTNSQKDKIFKEYFGGVGHVDNPKAFNINPNNKVVKGMEKYADAASYYTLVKTQDVYTKSLSAMAALDKSTRKHLDKGLEQVIRDGETWKITKEMLDESVGGALKDTFSTDYTKGRGTLNAVADVVERMSNAPYLGFLFPFGRFMNNNMAFILEYSPLSVMGIASKLPSKGGRKELAEMGEEAIGDRLAKATVGTVALATLIGWSAQQEADGFQWNEIEDSGGSVANRQNVAPASAYLIAARIGHLLEKGEGVPMELFTELGQQLGPGNMMRALDQDNPITPVIEALTQASSPEEQKGYMQLLGEAVKGITGTVASGMTRPLDALNVSVSTVMEDTAGIKDVTIDRRQAESILDATQQELFRYTDNLFAPFLGEENEDGKKTIGVPLRTSTRPEGDVRDPNPTATLTGRKEVLPKNDIDKLLGMVNFPAWKADQRTAVPGFDRFVNERVAPILNRKARALLDNKAFQNATQDVRLRQVKKLLIDVRDGVKKSLEDNNIGTPQQRLLQERAKWSSLPQSDRDHARMQLGITTPDKELNSIQLRQLREFVDNFQDFNDLMR